MATYTPGHHESVLRSHRWRTAANSAGYLLPHLVEGDMVLDVGCGPGSISQELADLVGPAGSVLGVDNAAAVIDVARAEGPDVSHGGGVSGNVIKNAAGDFESAQMGCFDCKQGVI